MKRTYQRDIRAEIEQIFVRRSLQNVAHLIDDVGLYIPCNPELLLAGFWRKLFFDAERNSC